MDGAVLIAAGVGMVFMHATLRLWHNRDAPGALPCLLLFATLSVYLPSMLLSSPSVPLAQLTYACAATLTPLLLVAVCDHVGLDPPGWRYLRLALPLAMALLATAILLKHREAFVAIAGAPDLAARSAVIRAARHGPFLATTVLQYAFITLTLAAIGTTLVRVPPLRREMTVLIAACAGVGGVDAAHYVYGATIAGMMPTPFAIAAAVVLGTLLMHRSHMFDVRPIARSLLIDRVRDAILVIDGDRRLVDLNGAAEALLGARRQALVGRTATDALPREFVAMLQSSVFLRAELAAHLADETVWFEVDVTPLKVRGLRAGHLMVARDISERHQAQTALEESRRALEAANTMLAEQSITDPLTGLKNRRFLFQRLDEELRRRARSGEVLGLLVLDLDHFKAVNDSHGHPVGDRALVQVARTLERTVRDTDVVARLGGEEFAIIAVNTDHRGLLGLAERMRRAIARTPVARDTRAPVILTASIGIAFAGPVIRTADELFAEADSYLYEAKRGGRNRVMAPQILAHGRG